MKILSALFLFFLLFFTSFGPVSASLVLLNKEGKVISKVLSASDATSLGVAETGQLSVTKIANSETLSGSIVLAKSGGKVNLTIGNDRSWDVTNWQEDLVEIEERGDTARINIYLKDGLFNLKQGDFLASTAMPISIDPGANKITLTTPTGDKFLKVLPVDAVWSALRSKSVTEVKTLPLFISEANGDLCYIVEGQKRLNLFNVYNLKMDIATKISASTGEVLSSTEPVWLKILSLLLTQYS